VRNDGEQFGPLGKPPDIHMHGVNIQPTDFQNFINQTRAQADRATFNQGRSERQTNTP